MAEGCNLEGSKSS